MEAAICKWLTCWLEHFLFHDVFTAIICIWKLPIMFVWQKCLLLLSKKIPHCPLNSNKEEYTNLPLILKTLCHSFPYPMSCSVYNVTVKHRLRKGNIAVKYGNLWNLTLSAASKWIREYYCINYPSNGYSCFQSWTLRRPKISLL